MPIKLNHIYLGDSLKILKTFPDNSIDTVITDPPYGLSNHSEKVIRNVLSHWLNGEDDYIPKAKGFMGKSWDAFVPPPRLWKEVFRVMKPGATALVFAGARTQDLMSMSLRLAGFEIKDTLMWLYGSGFPKATDISKQLDKMFGAKRKIGANYKKNNAVEYVDRKEEVGYETIPATPEAKLWDGYKSHNLKPAYEPIILAIKPNEESYVQNALKWGVAGLNIDGGRIKTSGRFPANILLDEEAAKMLDKQSSVKGNGASRFFYVAKASKRERNMGLDGFRQTTINDGRKKSIDNPYQRGKTPRLNGHPTVKPLKLMEYLVKLTKMPNDNQIYLDPFLGSGTTAMACKKLNRNWVGIELDTEYVKIAKARIKAIQRSLL